MNFSKLNQFLDELPARGYPASELAITLAGETVYRNAVGFSDAKGTKPVSPSDLYWIFSATKIITCTAAMRLVEEGRIRLEGPVSKYLPEFESMVIRNKDKSIVPAKNTMTILHLFTMSAGLNYRINTPALLTAKEQNASTLEMVRAIASEPLDFEPGTRYSYSLCHDVLAAVVEVVSGMPFSAYLKQYIFDPLGIQDMGFLPSEEQKERFSTLYTYSTSTMRAKEIPCVNPYRLSERYESGGAGLFASVDEYTKIITTLALGGTTKDGYRLLKPETVHMMQENRLPTDVLRDFVITKNFGYGFGLCGRAHMDPFLSFSRSPVGEFGWDSAGNAYVLIDPKNKLALFFGAHILDCQYGYYAIHPRLRDLTYEALDL